MMFTVLDQTEKRLDLAERREVKFVLEGSDIGSVRRVLETNTRRQIHNHKVSTVRSVYFDDACLSAVRPTWMAWELVASCVCVGTIN